MADAQYAVQIQQNPGTTFEEWVFESEQWPVRKLLSEAQEDFVSAMQYGYPTEDLRLVIIVPLAVM